MMGDVSQFHDSELEGRMINEIHSMSVFLSYYLSKEINYE